MTSTAHDGPDTALAHVLHAQGALPLPTLQTLLERVRAQRLHDPHASLEALLRANHTLPPHTLQRALDSLAPPPPTLGPYVLQRELARGGMGAVHLALDPHTGAHLALKTLPRELAQDPDLLLRFQAEAQLAAQLDHPHIARVHAADFSADPPYLVQELLTGGSLQDRLQHGPLPVDEAVAVVSQLCDAVAHAHQHGVIHRDLKPDNVLFDEHGHAKLVDFGLARQLTDAQRLTRTGELLGTPNYMAPEQADDAKNTDERTDVYGLGGILYACLTGRPPFAGSNLYALLQQVLEDTPSPPSQINPAAPEWLDRVVLHALAKQPLERPESARSLARSLSPSSSKPRRRRSLLLTLPLALVIPLFLLRGADRPHAPPPPERPTSPPRTGSPPPNPLQRAEAALRRGDSADARQHANELRDPQRSWVLLQADLLDGNDTDPSATHDPLWDQLVQIERSRDRLLSTLRQHMLLRDYSQTFTDLTHLFESLSTAHAKEYPVAQAIETRLTQTAIELVFEHAIHHFENSPEYRRSAQHSLEHAERHGADPELLALAKLLLAEYATPLPNWAARAPWWQATQNLPTPRGPRARRIHALFLGAGQSPPARCDFEALLDLSPQPLTYTEAQLLRAWTHRLNQYTFSSLSQPTPEDWHSIAHTTAFHIHSRRLIDQTRVGEDAGPYLRLGRLLVATLDTNRLHTLLERTAARSHQIKPLEHARLSSELALLRADFPRALQITTHAIPQHPPHEGDVLMMRRVKAVAQLAQGDVLGAWLELDRTRERLGSVEDWRLDLDPFLELALADRRHAWPSPTPNTTRHLDELLLQLTPPRPR